MNNNNRIAVVAERVCIKYAIGFKYGDMEKKKLTQEFNDGTKRTREVAVFSGTEGVEGLLHVKRDFDKACEYLSFDTGREKVDNFALVVTGSAADNWMTSTEEIENEDVTNDMFNQLFRGYLLKYCTSDARDLLFDYLRSNDCRKPHDADVRVHCERIRTLCGLANRLPGIVPVLDEQMKKKILYDTFPEKWKLNFAVARKYETSTEQDIIDFMCIQKTVADQDERKRSFSGRGGGPPAQRGRFGGRGPGRGFGMHGRGFGGRHGFNGGGRNNFFGRGNYNNGGRFNNNGYNGNNYNGNGNGNGNGGSFQNGNGGRFQGRFQNNFNRGRVPSGRAPMGRGPPAASQHQHYMIQGREPQDGRANDNNASSAQASSTHENYNDGNYDGYYYEDQQQHYNDESYYYDDQQWQQPYGFDNFYADYENDHAGW